MASQIVDGKLTELAQGLRQNIVEPMQATTAQTAQAIAQLSARQDEQSQAMVKLFQLIQAAQQEPYVGSPVQTAPAGPAAPAAEMAPVAGMPVGATMPIG
jgi:hypothetical protein